MTVGTMNGCAGSECHYTLNTNAVWQLFTRNNDAKQPNSEDDEKKSTNGKREILAWLLFGCNL